MVKRNAIRLGSTVSGEQIAALGDVELNGDKASVAGFGFYVSPHSEEWICDRVPPTASEVEAAKVAHAARTMPWKTFVCWYVARRTARKACEGYRVRKSRAGWAVSFGQIDGAGPMLDGDEVTVYSWFERLPLVTLSREADSIRYDTLTAS